MLDIRHIQLQCGSVEMETSNIVLYVEDEADDALFMKWAFTKAGLESRLRHVEDGRAALDYLSGKNEFANRDAYPAPAVVLLDLNLPGVHGFEVLRWMRQQQQYASTPVVIFSSSSAPEDKTRSRELGANEYFEKPNSGLSFSKVVMWLKDKWLTPAQSAS
jgi:CheY-like chemotaxis protein